MCHSHKKVIERLPQPLQLACRMRDILADLVPVDIVDMMTFAFRTQSFREDVAIQIVVALMKQPTATKVFVETCCEWPSTASSMAAAFEQVLSSVKVTDKTGVSEMQQLLRQGVGRFTGLASTCRLLGVIGKCEGGAADATAHGRHSQEKKGRRQDGASSATDVRKTPTASADAETPSASAGDDERMQLGLGDLTYVKTCSISGLEGFVKACRQQPPKPSVVCPTTLLAFSGWATCVVLDVGKASDIPCGSLGYISKFLVRKLVLAELAAPGAPLINWAEVSLAALATMSADAGDMLAAFPPTYSAQAVSNVIFGRGDWGMFASMFGCLFKEVVDKCGYDEAASISMSHLTACLQQRKAATGVTPCPYELVAAALQKGRGAQPSAARDGRRSARGKEQRASPTVTPRAPSPAVRRCSRARPLTTPSTTPRKAKLAPAKGSPAKVAGSRPAGKTSPKSRGSSAQEKATRARGKAGK
jgi:hypothetical protein